MNISAFSTELKAGNVLWKLCWLHVVTGGGWLDHLGTGSLIRRYKRYINASMPQLCSCRRRQWWLQGAVLLKTTLKRQEIITKRKKQKKPPSNGTIADVVLCDLDPYFQGHILQVAIKAGKSKHYHCHQIGSHVFIMEWRHCESCISWPWPTFSKSRKLICEYKKNCESRRKLWPFL